jgi:hypothetical protein
VLSRLAARGAGADRRRRHLAVPDLPAVLSRWCATRTAYVYLTLACRSATCSRGQRPVRAPRRTRAHAPIKGYVQVLKLVVSRRRGAAAALIDRSPLVL